MARILLIDDDTDMSNLFRSMLTTGEFTVEIANDGPTGMAMVKQSKFDLILLDIMMPQMNGMDVLEQLKKMPELGQTPVVMFSNFADEKYHQLSLKKGAARYLVKSDHDPDDLISIIQEVIGRTGGGATVVTEATSTPAAPAAPASESTSPTPPSAPVAPAASPSTPSLDEPVQP